MTSATTATPVYFTVTGSVRGACGHKHTTLTGAERCLEGDRKGCASQGGYSDRSVYGVAKDGTETRYLSYFDGGRVMLGESTPDAGAFA